MISPSGVPSRREVIVFYVASLVLSWPALLLWRLPCASEPVDLVTARDAYGRVGLFYGFGPMVAALIAALWCRRVPGVVDLIRRVATWRVSVWWYLAALLLAIVPQWLGIGLWGVATEAQFDLDMPLVWLSQWVQFTAFVGLLSIGEEIGWRGSMLPGLVPRHRWRKASLIVGAGWAVWQAPLWFVFYWTVTGSTLRTAAILALLAITTIALSVILARIVVGARDSVLPAMLFSGSAAANLHIFYARTPEATSSIGLPLAIAGMSALLAVIVALFPDRPPPNVSVRHVGRAYVSR